MRMPKATMCVLTALAFSAFAAGPGLASKSLDGKSGASESDAGETISESQARSIAWSAGLVHIEEIILYGDRWEIAGRSADDDEMMLDIDIRNGRILD